MSKLEHSWSRFAQGIDHHGSMNCNAKIVNRFLDAQAHSSFGLLDQLDRFIDFTVSKRASQRPTPTTQGIFVPNPFTVIRSQLSTLLGIPTQEVQQELHQGWDHGVRIAWLSDWTLLRALTPSTASYQSDACHGFLLLIFGTLLFPYAPNLIDGALAQVVLQAVGGHSYVEALLAETVRSLDYVREVRYGRMRGSPHLLQVWLLAHIRPFCSSHPFSYIADERSLIERLVPVFPPLERSFSEWRHFWRKLTPARFLWVARWNPGGPMITGCPRIAGVPLLSHLESTLIFPGRVIRQLVGLQDIPVEADHLPYRIQWADSTSTAPARFLQIREIHRQRDASTIQRRYFLEHPTDKDQALSATSACVVQFYSQGSASPQRSQTASIPRATPTSAPEVESSTQTAMRAELQSIKEERDRLRCELVDSRAEVADYRELQTELDREMARLSATMAEEDRVDVSEEVNPPVSAHSQPPSTHAPPPPTPTSVLPAYSVAPPTHLPPPTSSGAPLPRVSLTSSASDDHARIAPLEGTLYASFGTRTNNRSDLLDSTNPNSGGHGCSRPTPTMHRPTVHPFTSPFPPPPAPAAVPLPPAALLSSEQALSAPPPISMSAPTAVYTVPSLMANETRPNASYGDCSLFPGMRLPSKFKIPEFKTYQGTTDPRHHLRHYRGKMLQYWDHEEFIIHSFQDSLSGSALDWFMGVYYSHLLAHTSSFSDLIEAGKKLDLGIKLGRMEGFTNKGEEPSKKAPATTTSSSGRRGKEVSVNVVNPAHPTPQQYSVGVAQYRSRKQYTPLPAPLSHIYRQLLAGNQIQPISPGPNFDPTTQDQFKHCEYHQGAPGHTLDNCWRLRDEIQERIDNNRLTFNAVRPPNVQANPLPDHRPSSGSSINMISICTLGEDTNAQGNPLPFVIDYTPEEPTVGFAGHMASPAPFIVDIPAREPYLDNKVPWIYEGGIGSIERQFSVMGVTRSGRLYENPVIVDKGKAPAVEVGAVPERTPFPSKRVTEEEAEAFMKIIKASEYKVVEQMAKALLRVLTAAQVPKETPPDRIEETVASIFSNTISFSDDELPSEGWTHSRALHIVCKCNNYIIGRVLIDNGSALNVCPVLKIPNAFRLLLERPWIHLAGVVPSSLHQRLKFIIEEKLIMVKGEEDYAIYKETTVPYISVGDDENLPFHSFETISVIRDYGEIGPSRADRMIWKVLLRHNYIPGAGLGACGQGINRPIEVEEYKHRRGLGFRPSCHEIIEARRGNNLHRLAGHYGRLNRGMQVPPLSHFFPGPPLIIGSTLDGPSSDFDDTPDAFPTVYAVTEEIPSGVHIRPAQENEELNNWTSVPRYSAVIADFFQFPKLHSNPNLRHVDSNPLEECLGEPGPIYFGEGLDEDSQVPDIEESLHRLEDRQLTSVKPTEEINVGTEDEPRTLKIGTGLDPTQRARMIDFLTRYQEVFAWS
ncbi:hypothetical protein CRG98_039250 [Punica granatum]|uniref:G-patch domain-containing protein n=1 Tax=Punica granatum TaxID=22663 RepID=A0A2I0I8Q2_PUNGR|nr:hypothetical protein CRG98_039250 [Punica granatum]